MDERLVVEGYIMGVYAERYGMASRDPASGFREVDLPIKEVEEAEKNFQVFFNLLGTLEYFAYELYHG